MGPGRVTPRCPLLSPSAGLHPHPLSHPDPCRSQHMPFLPNLVVLDLSRNLIGPTNHGHLDDFLASTMKLLPALARVKLSENPTMGSKVSGAGSMLLRLPFPSFYFLLLLITSLVRAWTLYTHSAT